jgi:hypothetical protein
LFGSVGWFILCRVGLQFLLDVVVFAFLRGIDLV